MLPVARTPEVCPRDAARADRVTPYPRGLPPEADLAPP